MQIPRKKPRKILFSIIYRISKIKFLSNKKKLTIFLNMNWWFWRLAHEQAEIIYQNEIKDKSLSFILKKLKTTHNILDLGCKYGTKSELFSENVNTVTAIDYDSIAIEIAKKQNKNSNVKFICSDALKYISKQNAKYDVVILSHILEHIENPKDFITKITPSTDLIYIEVPDFECNFLNQYRLKLSLNLNYTDDDHVWEFNRDELEILFKQLGIKILDCQFRFGLQQYWLSTK
jgi:SAM-dependent methyltransferase